MKRLSEAFREAVERLSEAHLYEPRLEAEALLCSLLQVSKGALYLKGDRMLTDDEARRFSDWTRRRANREPLQYIAGQVEFFECRIAVNPSVLIPRPETELLVEKAIGKIRALKLHQGVLCDLCCGSGCIGIAVKKALPGLRVILSDISKEALAVAEANAKTNGVDVELRLGDGLSTVAEGELDILLSNPPYIAESEYLCLDPEVRDHEPKLALVSGASGFEFYERLSFEALSRLKRPSMLLFEIGRGMGDQVLTLFSGYPKAISAIERDYSGHDRFFFLENR